MGGEWTFLIKPKAGLSAAQWQSELRRVRKKFASVIGLEAGTTTFFADADHPESMNDNVFARFTYEGECHHGESGMWCLPWDPWQKVPKGHIHARCAPYNFARYSYEIQRHLENAFPESILIEWGDGIDGYNGSLLRSRGWRYHYAKYFPEIPRPLPRIDISDLLLDVRSQLGLQLFSAIVHEDEDMVFRLIAEEQLDINFIAPYGPEQANENGKRHFVRRVSAVRLAVEQLVNSPYKVDHPEVLVQLRILQMILFRDPKLEFPKFRSSWQDETEDLARHVLFDVVGYGDTLLDGPSFTPLQSGLAEVRIRMTLLHRLLPALKQRGLLQAALVKLERTELEWLIDKKPGWQLVKILQVFQGQDEIRSESLVSS
ncbi:unnamed protein product [Durusdinium trenchii]|uniref:Uncharacterized protein n=2 Tax=Durusdinium trenchii TaxID=1381693 RepID=A0ABP0NJF8_9DINO